MRHPRFSWPVLFCLAALVPALPARAQQPEDATAAPSSDNDQKAYDLFRKGKQANQQGDTQAAYTYYKAAWDLKKSLDIATNLGVTEYNLSLANNNSTAYMRDAAEHLLFASQSFPFLDPAAGPGQPDRHRELRKQQAAVNGLLDEARKLVGTVYLTVRERDCQVFDGETLLAKRDSPFEKLEVFIEPGTRTVEVRRPGFKPTQKTVEVEAGSKQDLEVEVPTEQDTKAGPIGPVKSPQPGPETPVDPALQRRRKTVLIGGMSAAGAGVFVGTVTAIVSSVKGNDADEQYHEIEMAGDPRACASPAFQSKCDEVVSLQKSHDTLANVAIWSFVGASLVAGGTAAYYMLTATPAAPATAPSVGIAVTPDGGGVVVKGAF